MDPLLRGLLEQRLDYLLNDETLQTNFKFFKVFKDLNLIDSVESALFSHIYTKITTLFYAAHMGEIPNMKDSEELSELFISRSLTIKTRIREVCNL